MTTQTHHVYTHDGLPMRTCHKLMQHRQNSVKIVQNSERSWIYEASAALPLQTVQVNRQRQGTLTSAVMHQEQGIADAVCDCHALVGQNKQRAVGHLRAASISTDVLHSCIKPSSQPNIKPFCRLVGIGR